MKKTYLTAALLLPLAAAANHKELATGLALNSISASTYATSQGAQNHVAANNIDYVRENHAAIQNDIAVGDGEALQAALTLYNTSDRPRAVQHLRRSLSTLAALPADEKAAQIDAILRT